MLTLSIQQPWADLIINHGKDIENRSWSTEFRGQILIHTGSKFDRESFDKLKKAGWYKNVFESHFQKGGIVGITEIVGCVTESPSVWFFGEFGFVLQNSKPLPFHRCKGQLMIYNTPYIMPA